MKILHHITYSKVPALKTHVFYCTKLWEMLGFPHWKGFTASLWNEIHWNIAKLNMLAEVGNVVRLAKIVPVWLLLSDLGCKCWSNCEPSHWPHLEEPEFLGHWWRCESCAEKFSGRGKAPQICVGFFFLSRWHHLQGFRWGLHTGMHCSVFWVKFSPFGELAAV